MDDDGKPDTTGTHEAGFGMDAEARRWRLVARLGEALDVADVDWDKFSHAAAGIVAEELADVAFVAVLDPPGHPTSVVAAVAHHDPDAAAHAEGLLAAASPEGIRRLVDSFARSPSKVIVDPAEAMTEAQRATNADYAATVGGVRGQLATVLRRGDQVLGVIFCTRDSSSPPFDAADEFALATAADTIGVRLQIALGRRAEAVSEHRWSVVFDNAPIGMAVMNRDTVITAINAAACEVFGRPAEEIIGRSRYDFCHPDDLPAARAFIADAEAGRADRVTQVERAVRPDGSIRWVRASRVVVRDATGEPTAYYSQSVDVTEQFEAEAEAERFAAVVQSSPDFIGFADLDGRMIFVNEAGRAMVHLPPDIDVTTLMNTDFVIREGVDGEQSEYERISMTDLGHVEMMSNLRDWADGSEIPVYASSFAVRDTHTGAVIAYASIRRDMRDQLEAQRRLEETAEQRSRLLAELLAAEQNERERIADDIHDEAVQLLAAAQLRTQLLGTHIKRNDMAAVQRTAGDVSNLIVSSLRQLRMLLADLQPAEAYALSMSEIIRRATDQLFAGTDVVIDVEGDLHDLPNDVMTVLSRGAREALSNARKHSQATEVSVRFAESAAGWTVLVEDDGVGVPAQIPRRPGHLGMRAMASRVEALGGTCVVARRPGGGTRVELTVPRPR